MPIIHIETYEFRDSGPIAALVRVKPEQLLHDGVLHEKHAAAVLSDVLADTPHDFDGLSLTYLDDSGCPQHHETFEFALPKGCAARTIVHMADGTRMFRSQRSLAPAYKVIDLTLA